MERRPIVVVGFDGSAESAEAVAVALRETEHGKGELRVVTAHTNDWSGPDPEPEDWRDRMRRHTEALQAETVTEMAPGGQPSVAVRYVAVTGNAGAILVEHSADAALLVVGSRGMNPLASAVLGSVSNYVLRHARCPVLVVRLHPDHPRGHVASVQLAGRV